MSDKTNSERIDALEKRVSELKDQVANASSPRLFMKAIVTLLLVGTFFFIWKARNIIKWLFLAFIAWMVFGGTVRNICSTTGNFISTTWAEMRANGKVDAEGTAFLPATAAVGIFSLHHALSAQGTNAHLVSEKAGIKTRVLKA